MSFPQAFGNRNRSTPSKDGASRSGAVHGASSVYNRGHNTSTSVAPGNSKTDRVLLDGLVIMQIIKHCSESLPTFVAGSLLGLDVENRLEITHSFPFPTTSDSASDPQMDMLKALREVNVDNNQIGWYQSTYLGSYCSKDLIITQFEFQEHLGPNTVVIVYDPVRSSSGNLAIKALRLSDSFMQAYKDKKISADAASKIPLSSGAVFEEVPLRIHNPQLIQALLVDLEAKEKMKEVSSAANFALRGTERKQATQTSGSSSSNYTSSSNADRSLVDTDFERLDLSVTPFLEKNLQFLSDQIDDLASAQNHNMHQERRAAQLRKARAEFIAERVELNKQREAEGQEPLPLEDQDNALFQSYEEGVDRLETLLMSAQVSNYCDQINEFAGQSFGKLFLAGGLHA